MGIPTLLRQKFHHRHFWGRGLLFFSDLGRMGSGGARVGACWAANGIEDREAQLPHLLGRWQPQQAV